MVLLGSFFALTVVFAAYIHTTVISGPTCIYSEMFLKSVLSISTSHLITSPLSEIIRKSESVLFWKLKVMDTCRHLKGILKLHVGLE